MLQGKQQQYTFYITDIVLLLFFVIKDHAPFFLPNGVKIELSEVYKARF